MFCGTGKTRIILQLMIKQQNNLSVIVFPSISLITQFNKEYLLKNEWSNLTNKFKCLSICSKNELSYCADIQYTTEQIAITNFLQNKNNKIICVTYQSFTPLKI